MSTSGMNDLDAGGGRRPSDKGGKIDIQERMRRRFQQKARASPSGSASPSSYSGSQPGATGYGQRLNISSPSQASHVSADISINEPDDNGNSLFGSNTPSKRSPEVKRVHENGNFHKEDTKGQQSKDEFMALFQNNFEDTEQKKSESKTSGLDEDENDEHMKSLENTDSDHSEEDNRSGNQRLLQGTRNNHPSAFSNQRQPIESADNNPIARLIRLQQQGRKGSDDDSDEEGGAAPIGGFGIGGLPGKSFRADDSDSEGSVEDENPFNSLVKSLKNAQVNVRSQMPNAEADDPFAKLRAPIGSGRLGGTQNPDVSPIGGIQGGRGMGRYQTARGEAPARVSEGGRKSEPGSGQRPGYGGNQPSSGAGNKAPKAGGAPAPANPSGKDSGRSKQADGFGGIGGFGAPIPSDGLDNDPIKQMLRDMAKDAPGGGDDEPPNLKKMLAKLRAEREAGGDGAANQGNNPDPGSQGGGGEEGQMDPLAQMLGGGGGGAGGQANPLAQMFGGGAGGAGGQANPLAQMLGGGAGGAGGQANPLAQMFGGGAGGEGGQSNPLAQMFGGGGAGGGGDALAQMMGGVGAGPAGRRGGSQADMMRQMMSGGRGGGGQADQMMQMLAGAGGRGGGGQADQMMQMLAGAGGGRPGGLQGRRQQGGGGEEEEDVNVENPGDMQVIHQMLAYESMRAQNSHCPRAHNAMNTIIIIDTSGSMGGDAMIEAGEFLSQFLNGLEELQFEFNLEENVALVSVADGGQVVQHFTNDYSLVRRATDTLCAEGPSKLHIGLIMPIALLPLDQNTRGGMLTLQGHMVPPRVILITDGQLSGVTDVPGQQPNQQQSNMLQTMSLELMNQNYLDMVASTSGGKVVHPTSAKLLSRYHLHQMVVAALKKESANEPSRGIIMEKLKTVTGHCEDAEVDAILEMWQQPPPDVDERDQRLIKQSVDGGGGRGVPMMGGRGRGGGQMDMSAMLAGRGGGGLQDMLGGRGQGGGPGGLPDISAILGGQGGAGAGGLPDMASLLGGMGRGGGGGIADMAALLGGRGGGGGGRPDIAALLGGRGGGGAGGLPDMSALFGGRGRGEGGEGMPDMSALFGGRGGGGAGDMQDLAAMLGGVGGVGGDGAPGNLAAMLGGIRAGGGGNGDGGGGMDMAAMLGGGGGMKMGGGFPGGAGMLQMAEDGGFFSRKQRDEEPPQEKKRGRGYGGDPKVFTLNKLPDNARTSKPKLHELKPSKPLPVPPKVFTGNPKYPDGIIPGMAGGMNPVGGAAFPQNMQNPVPGAGFQQNPQNFGNMAAGGGQQQQSADQFQGSRITRPDLRVEYRERSDSEDEAEAIGGFN
ncbi:hypothetical protein MAR_024858 [Mya arenaria]|uniref:VWFA domain-containing protein n=1 Tax=Mya arenaria TaxID=6604 RepID=A0ABY7DUX8_MYAAR|nr:hypothetical protein MAR_024858 [Mya arenaria]